MGGHGGAPPIQRFFFEKPHQNQCPPMGHQPPPHLKMKPPLSEKQPLPPPSPLLKREVPFHEMIPRKSTINNNLKSS